MLSSRTCILLKIYIMMTDIGIFIFFVVLLMPDSCLCSDRYKNCKNLYGCSIMKDCSNCVYCYDCYDCNNCNYCIGGYKLQNATGYINA